MSSKEMVLEVVQQMPSESTLEKISEKTAILAAIERGEKAIREGRTFTHEEVQQRLSRWTSM